MEKRQRQIGLSAVLLLASIRLLFGMLLLCGIWLAGMTGLEHAGIVYHGSEANRQTEELLAGSPDRFYPPEDDFLGEYVLFGKNGEVLEKNIDEKSLQKFRELYEEENIGTGVKKHVYPDGSTAVLRWHYRKEFVDPSIRKKFPPAETLWFLSLGAALVVFVFFNTLVLRRYLSKRLALFSEVSRKIGGRELDFVIPKAGIREYDQALEAMEQMREALYCSLSEQWTAQQEREAEMAALAHDLKTPLTLAAGNAELILENELFPEDRKRVETILAGCRRAQGYVADLLETAAGSEEPVEKTDLFSFFDEFLQEMELTVKARGLCLKADNHLEGTVYLQKERMRRALENVVLNAVEHSPAKGTVYVDGGMDTDKKQWQITVRDEGNGFSQSALLHGNERLWRDDSSRSQNGHNGLGLWSADRTLRNYGGSLILENWKRGAKVRIIGTGEG